MTTQNQTGNFNLKIANIGMIPSVSGVTFNWNNTSPYEMTSLGTNFILSTSSAVFDMPVDGRLRYIGSQNIVVAASAWIRLNNSGNYTFYIYKNGSLASANAVAIGANATFLILPVNIDMATNDYLSLFIARSTSPYSGPIYNVSLSVVS
jgi:hypothetical protein